jgi:hypothetical protein
MSVPLAVTMGSIDCGSGLLTATTYTCRSSPVRALDAFAMGRLFLQTRVEAIL